MALYTGRMDLGDSVSALLRSDRPDGLFPTLVADERGAVLGMAYSNRETLKLAIKEKKGIYYSRKRGVWRKGETSGAMQQLLKVTHDTRHTRHTRHTHARATHTTRADLSAFRWMWTATETRYSSPCASPARASVTAPPTIASARASGVRPRSPSSPTFPELTLLCFFSRPFGAHAHPGLAQAVGSRGLLHQAPLRRPHPSQGQTARGGTYRVCGVACAMHACY
jgi:phosphoribosyl-AMP cyclohydrolase